MTMFRNLVILVLATALAFAQGREEFEVASIRPSGDQPAGQAGAGFTVNGSQLRIANLSLKDYVAIAYDVQLNQVTGPDWLGSPRFDISAKLPEGAKSAGVNEMLETLLIERFRMKTHREKREFPVYALEVLKTGLKVAETSPDGDPMTRGTGQFSMAAGGNNAGVAIDLGEGSLFMLGSDSLETRKLTMSTMANLLTRFLDRPVIDLTNLKAGYDLKLPLSPEDRMMMLIRSALSAGVVLPPQALALLDMGSAASLQDSLKKAGLSLEARRAPLDVIVVDDIQKAPTEN
jgi:uncharacterized protein (TIGR03435 family)